ncbi:uncharacterized protein TrAtP1_000350 [Trichoderma atroviride]|uniref:uncharacterized protein n=1 Tax=Hypocrea atroviridis TaxID=63577 RepID=UPI00332200D1|nr:hypothetical protein TrAtP1_000350 [Trichoderma atroviride]
MSKHDEEDVENAKRSTQTLRVKVNEGSIEEIQLCLQFSAPEEISKGLLKSASGDMQRLSLGEANGGLYESDDLYGDADESVSRTMQGLNQPSFQPSRRLGDGSRYACSRKETTHDQGFAAHGCEAEGYGDESITQIAAEELEGGDVGDFDYIDEDSAAKDEDVGDARMPGGAVV